jgi:replication factor A1
MRRVSWFGRGRPPGKHHSRSDMRGIEYLARISVKHGLDSDELFASLIDAWKNKKSECEDLRIECREKTEDGGVFLLTRGDDWFAQFQLAEHFLIEANPLKEFVNKMLVRAQYLTKNDSASLKIKDLFTGQKHVKVKARVIQLSKPQVVFTRFGTQAYVSNVIIGDDTETIALSLWNNQVAAISEGDVIQIENGYVASFMGKRQLRIGRRGTISIVEDEEFVSMQ